MDERVAGAYLGNGPSPISWLRKVRFRSLVPDPRWAGTEFDGSQTEAGRKYAQRLEDEGKRYCRGCGRIKPVLDFVDEIWCERCMWGGWPREE